MSEKAALIDAERAHYKISWMCRLLEVPRASFYAWRARVDEVTQSEERRRRLRVLIKTEYERGRGVYGCRRITSILNIAGHACSVGLVAKLMREMGLAGIQKRAWKKTTTKDNQALVHQDLVNRDFDPSSHEVGSVLVGDITYLKTGTGWLYLATVIDLATRMVIGWQMAPHMRTSLVIDALEMARTQAPLSKGIIFHSDHGSQYGSKEMHQYCQKHGINQSMGAVGVCWDNAVAEAFFSTLKNEMYHHHVFINQDLARHKVAEYIEVFYNRIRPHSALGYQTPAQAWEQQTTHVTQVA